MKLLLSLAVAILVASPLGAENVKVPENEPVFSFNLPEGWTLKSAPGGDVECVAGDGSNFSFFFADYQSSFKDESELKELLAIQAKAVADGGKENNPKVSVDPMRERETNHKVRIFSVTLHMAVPGGEDMVQVFAGFVPKAGRYFLLGSVASVAAHKANEKAMNEVLDSIKPVEGEAPNG
jgi:hypothetical protein